MQISNRLAFAAALVLLAGCGKTPETAKASGAGAAQAHDSKTKDEHAQDGYARNAKEVHADHDEHEGAEKGGKAGADEVHLSKEQIAAARIEVSPVRTSVVGAVEAPATIEADPARSQTVAAAIGGRVVALQRNLGEMVRRGDTLAVIESAEAAEMKAEYEAARRQLDVTRVALEREERLYKEKVSAEQDVLAARAAAGDAQTRSRLAQQRLAAIGAASGGPLNRVLLRAPITGHVVARSATVGSVITADTELYRIADLSQVAVKMALNTEDASRVTVGQTVQVSTASRNGSGKIAYVSPIIDPETRQVQALATLPNPGAKWRVGETVRASVAAASSGTQASLAVPRNAIQTVEDKPTVFVRTNEGFAARHVVLGPANGSEAVVLSGLAAGDSVAVANSYVLKAELAKGEGGGEHHH